MVAKVLSVFLPFLALLTWPGAVLADPKDQERWDAKYAQEEYVFGKEPIAFLKEHVHLLPKGKALDLAMGEGRNGVFLATQGFQVIGVDISEKGLAKARKLAQEQKVGIETRVVDLEQARLEPNVYDVVLCLYYLQRDLVPQIKGALKSGGMVVMETYNLDHLKYNPKFRKEYLLQPNELLDLFKDFTIIRYQAYDDGKAAYSSLIARKPLTR
jgi:2-polyprenyl-3-methyl-5-hydroxy-6-metoxy-1,4-benzoquinol methylase